MDRTGDPLTPLCTQLTYEGLVDETLHIKNGVVQLSAEGVSASPNLSALLVLVAVTVTNSSNHNVDDRNGNNSSAALWSC